VCGLAGLLLSPQRRSAATWAQLRAQFTDNLLANARRGRAATGAALVQRDGTVLLHKAPLPPAEFVETREYQDLLHNLNQHSAILLGHTRHPTQGSPLSSYNNHPLHIGNVVGAHNGHIHNDAALFDHFGFPRRGEVDSEVIFRLLNSLDPTLAGLDYLDRVRETAQQLQGPLGVLAVDLRRPRQLLVIKRGVPLSVHVDAATDSWHFSSRYLFLRKTFGPVVILEDNVRPDTAYLFDPALGLGFLRRPL
jgi:glucosamine 6-phosphate synthetase-like amidotransferase/phosphosugar isomerase protein